MCMEKILRVKLPNIQNIHIYVRGLYNNIMLLSLFLYI